LKKRSLRDKEEKEGKREAVFIFYSYDIAEQ